MFVYLKYTYIYIGILRLIYCFILTYIDNEKPFCPVSQQFVLFSIDFPVGFMRGKLLDIIRLFIIFHILILPIHIQNKQLEDRRHLLSRWGARYEKSVNNLMPGVSRKVHVYSFLSVSTHLHF